ncbi:MAG: tetratricopeptide repeat protein [Vicingaceae bacterium]|nr:tetratricopeptide repeat protein [Vicingaceae bacterium]
MLIKLKLKFYLFFFILCLGICNITFAQKNKDYYLIENVSPSEYSKDDKATIDRAMKKYHSAKHDSDMLNAIEIITENMMHEDWERYNDFIHNLSINLLKKKLSPHIKKRYEISVARAVNNKGVIFHQQGNMPMAIKYFHESLAYQEKLGNRSGAAASLNNIGAIYNNQGNEDKALEYLLKALKIRKEIGGNRGIAQSLNNVGSIYYKMTDYPKAMKYYKQSLTHYKKIDNKEGMAYTLSNMGNIYDNQNLAIGLKYHLKSLKLRQEIGDKKGECYALFNVGESYLDKGDIQNSLKYGKASYALAKGMKYPDNIQRAANLLSRIYKKQGHYERGWMFYEEFVHLKDSIQDEKNKQIAVDQEAKYNYEKEQAIRDAEYKKNLEISNEKQQTQKVISWSVAFGLILVLIFSYFIYSRLKVTSKQKEIIEHQKKLVDVKNQEITDSITYAKRIQDAILPSQQYLQDNLKDGFVFYQPKDIVAGDFYWVEPTSEGVLYAAADCTGHGVPGAMVSVVCNNALERAVREFNLLEPGVILDKVSELVAYKFNTDENDVRDGMDIALCKIAYKTNILSFSGANNPLYIIRNGKLIETKGDKQPIGKAYDVKPFTTHKIQLEKGDTIYTLSDGYPDQFGGNKGKKFKYQQFKNFLISIQQYDMEKQKELIAEKFNAWKGGLEQIDDVLVLGIRI